MRLGINRVNFYIVKYPSDPPLVLRPNEEPSVFREAFLASQDLVQIATKNYRDVEHLKPGIHVVSQSTFDDVNALRLTHANHVS